MPRARRKCPHCRNWQPCKTHPQGWINNTSRPLPSNWNALKRMMGSVKYRGCAWCGQLHSLELDHIIPRSKDGSDELSNLQWLCTVCHRVKGSQDKKKPPA